ncbi:GNAT family N-acetyltransferase [Roseibium sp. SCPC15]|uniref:GNAT family N-acetyltransferase n=1 Tax=Roseibium sp. SCP15 TaxID=3141376 RepID=UPI00333C974E
MTTEIRHARQSDRSAILEFIDTFWRKDHIFVREPSFFDYEMTTDGVPQFILAVNSNQIVGLVGYVKHAALVEESDLFLVLLRVLESHANEGLAIKLLKTCLDLTNKNVHTVGANPKALPLYSLMGFKTGYLDHYYWLNPQIGTYNLAHVPERLDWQTAKFSCNVTPVTSIEETEYNRLPHYRHAAKSLDFFRKRYFEHSTFSYSVYAVRDQATGGSLTGLGVTRLVEANQSRAMRIVDWIGHDDYFNAFAGAIQQHCLMEQCEFADFYCLGMSADILKQAGFCKILAETETIIPNYFSPFLQRNVSLTFCTTQNNNIKLFRGDGDQDRPV